MSLMYCELYLNLSKYKPHLFSDYSVMYFGNTAFRFEMTESYVMRVVI